MQFSAVEIRFIVTTYLYSTFTNDLKRKYFFSKNVQSYRVCSFKSILEAKWDNTGNLILTQVYDTNVIPYDTYELYLKEIYERGSDRRVLRAF